MNKNTILSVLMVFLIASSGFAGAVGTVSAQTTDTSGGESAFDKCVENVDGWALLNPVLIGGAQCIQGAFSPSDYDSSTELENEAWNQAVSIQDYTEQRSTEYQNWNDRSLSASLLEAEKPLIEAHYAEKSEADARSAASEQVREYYSGQLSSSYNANNQVYERAVSISKSTNADSNIDTPVIQFDVAYGYTVSTVSQDSYDTVTANATQDSEIKYTTRTLPNGDEFDYASKIVDVSVPDSFNSGDISDGYALKYVDSDSDGTKDQYNIVIQPQTIQDNTQQVKLVANDPYSSETRTITWEQNHVTRVDSIKSEYNTAQGEVETMATDLYSTHTKGTINPDDYVSGATLLEEYSQNDSHYSYSAAKAAVTGLNTDLDAQQIVQINGDTSTEYEGMILTGSEGPQIADHEVSTNGVFDNSSNVFDWDSGTSGQDTLTVVGGGTTDSYIGSSGGKYMPYSFAVNPDGSYALSEFRIVNDGTASNLDTSTNPAAIKTVTIEMNGGIEFLSSIDGTTMPISDGMGGTVSNNVTLDSATNTITITLTNTRSDDVIFTPPESHINLTPGDASYTFTVKNDSGNVIGQETANFTVGGDVTTTGTIDAVRQADSGGVSISDDGSSATIQKSAVDDYALVDVSDGNTYVAYGSQTAADAGIPTGFEVGKQYTASNFGSVMLTYQNGDKVETLREDTIDTFTILSASSASSGEEISVLDYSDGGQRTFTDTSNIREELENQQEVQDAINQRGDVDPAGAGGSVEQRLQDGLLGFGAGASLVVFIGGVLVVLWLVGRITSFA